MTTEILVGPAAEIAEGERRLLTHGALEIGYLRIDGRHRAFLNLCPHQGGPVCDGLVTRRVEEVLGKGREHLGMTFSEDRFHLVCPWHGWEFDVETGACAGDGRARLRRFEVIEREGQVYVVL